MALRRRQGKVTPPLGNEELVPAVMTPEKRDSGAGGGRYSGRRCTVDIDGLRFGRDLSRSLAFLWERRASKCSVPRRLRPWSCGRARQRPVHQPLA